MPAHTSRRADDSEFYKALEKTKYKKLHNGEFHPARTVRLDDETNDVKHGQFLWRDHRLATSPACCNLSHGAKLALEAFIGKHDKQTRDGLYGDFQRGVTFTPSDLHDFGISRSTAKTCFPILVKWGLLILVERGHMASKGRRQKSSKYRLSDAWKATLAPTRHPDADRANLPMMDDPRSLPEVMELVHELEEDCIWGRFGQYAVDNHFTEIPSTTPKNQPTRVENSTAVGQNSARGRSKSDPPWSSGEVTGEGGTGDVSNGEALNPRDKQVGEEYADRSPSGLASGHIDPVAAEEEKAIETIRRNQQRDAQIRAEDLTPIAENLDEAVDALPIPPQRADSESEAPGQ